MLYHCTAVPLYCLMLLVTLLGARWQAVGAGEAIAAVEFLASQQRWLTAGSLLTSYKWLAGLMQHLVHGWFCFHN